MGDYFIELRRKITEHKYYPHLLGGVRAIIMYLMYALHLAILLHFFEKYYQQYTEEYFRYSYIIEAAIATVLLFLIMNSVMLTFAIFCKREREPFLKLHKGAQSFDRIEERKALFSDSAFCTELIVFGALYLLFPLREWFASVSDLVLLIPGAASIPGIFLSVVRMLVFWIGVYLISLRARINARLYWIRLPSKLMVNKIWQSMSEKYDRSYSIRRMVLRLVGYLLVYLAGIWAGSLVVPALVSIGKVILMFRFEGWMWALVGVILAIVVVLALRKRFQFVFRLKRVCKNYGFQLFGMRFAFLSLFHDFKKYTFGIEANGKTYYCRLVSGMDRFKKMILTEEGVLIRQIEFHIPQPRMATSGPFVYMSDRGNGDDRVLFRIPFKSKYVFESEGEGRKILIFNPVPKRVQRLVDESYVEADNGDRIGDYEIYTGNAFLRALERETTEYDRKHKN